MKSQDLFDEWVSKLRHHRLYRQNEISMYPGDRAFNYPHFPSPGSPGKAENASLRKVQCHSWKKRLEWRATKWHRLIFVVVDLWLCAFTQCVPIRRQSTVPSAAALTLTCNSQAKVAAWLQSSDDMDKCSKGETTGWELQQLLQLLLGFDGDSEANIEKRFWN